jgi:hypothetical protein
MGWGRSTVSEVHFNVQLLNAVVAQELQGIDVDDQALKDTIARAGLSRLTPEEMADVVVSRVFIERAKGILVQIYDIDADSAFEMLKWWSQATNVKLRILAQRLTEELAPITRDYQETMLAACDRLLSSAHGPAGRDAPPPALSVVENS